MFLCPVTATGLSNLALTPGQTCQIWVEDVPFALLLTKEVFTNKDGSTGAGYLVTDEVTLSAAQMTTLYQKRWTVEVYHEALKQNASLTKSPTRTTTTQRNHLFASLCRCAVYQGNFCTQSLARPSMRCSS